MRVENEHTQLRFDEIKGLSQKKKPVLTKSKSQENEPVLTIEELMKHGYSEEEAIEIKETWDKFEKDIKHSIKLGGKDNG